MKKYLFLLSALMLVSSCNNAELERLRIENKELRKNAAKAEQQPSGSAAVGERLAFLTAKMRGAKALLKTNMGDITVEFFPDKAPITCLSFITRAEAGFYNGTTFHRVIENFMIQGGDPNSKDKNPDNDGMGGPKVAIPHEFNDIKHVPGILSMARVSDVAAGAGSQFFIMHGTAPHLDGQYTAFGKVISGMDVVNKIATLPKDATHDSRTVKPVTISSIEILGI
jgi:peptidyl-prolyl cis-trans isomerase B (cyclophilin B)